MPVQSTNLSSTLNFSAANQTWTILSSVTIGSVSGKAVASGQLASNLFNRGLLVSDSDWGVQLNGPQSFTSNAASGSIYGSDGVDVGGADGRIVNYGIIIAFQGRGANVGTAGRIDNSGEIQGGTIGAMAGDGGAVHNSGTIAGLQHSVFLHGTTTGHELVNRGVLDGAIFIDGPDNLLVNAGQIFGAIELRSGDDRLTNSGDIHGDVVLGDGLNLFDGRGGAMNGFGVFGGAGRDTMKGGGDDDAFAGGNGADRLNGKGGEDELTGGRSGDRLAGGGGGDTFIYEALADSDLGGSDIIVDFGVAEGDVIDLALIDANTTVGGNQAFAFIGTGAFSAAGQLRYAVSGGNATVGVDVDGDGAADLLILLKGVTSLSANDFEL